MIFKGKRFAILIFFTTTLLLAGCGDEESSDVIQTGESSGSQDGDPADILPLSEALEKHHLWFETDQDPTLGSGVRGVYVFENGEVSLYKKMEIDELGNPIYSNIPIKDILELSDDEILELYKEDSEILNVGEYNLDIDIDEYGQNTEFIKMETQKTKDAEEAGSYGSGEYEAIEFFPSTVNPTLSDITFAGFVTEYNDSGVATETLITRIDESFVGLKLDEPHIEKKNVTTEGE